MKKSRDAKRTTETIEVRISTPVGESDTNAIISEISAMNARFHDEGTGILDLKMMRILR